MVRNTGITLECTRTIAASAGTGTINPVTIKTSPIQSGDTEIFVPSNTRPRFLPQPIGFEAGSIVTMETITTIANDTSADSIKFYVAVSIQ